MSDKKELKITFIIILIWIILSATPLFPFITIIMIASISILTIISLMNVVNDPDVNNGKEGYYAEYGTSYGANAEKHKKYLKEKIANDIMNKK